MRRKPLFMLGLIVLLTVGGLGGMAIMFSPWMPDAEANVPNLDGYGFTFHGMRLNPPRPAPDFTLIDQNGNPFRLSDQQGHVVALFFGYTTCPDVCPATLAHFQQVKQLLGDDAQHVRFVFVSVDPARDTPAKLQEYISHFDEDFIGLSGSHEALSQVWADYGIYIERVEVPDAPYEYWLNHTSISYVIDTEGMAVGAHPFGIPPDKVAEDFSRLIRLAEESAS